MDLYSSTKPLFILFRILGLAPFKLKLENGITVLKFSNFWTAYNLLLLGLLFSGSAYIMPLRLKRSTFSFTVQVVVNSKFGFDAIVAALGILMAIFNAQRVKQFFRAVEQIDESFCCMNKMPQHYATKRFALIQLCFIITLLSPFFIYLLYVMLMEKNMPVTNKYFKYWMYWFIYYLVKLISFGLVFFFIDCVLVLKLRFSTVNDNLESYIARLRPRILSPKNRPPILSPLAACRTLRCVHGQLCDLACRVTSIYSAPILLVVAGTFLNLTSECYFTITSVAALISGDAKTASLGFAIYIISSLAVLVVLLTASCECTSTEANTTAVLIQKFIRQMKYSSTPKVKAKYSTTLLHQLLPKTCHDQLLEELQLFSTQLMHHQVQFTAGGFFALDSTLLYSMVGGVTTYLVILFQFQETSHSKAANSG